MISLIEFTQTRLVRLRWFSILIMYAAALSSTVVLGDGSVLPRLMAYSTVIASLNACFQVALLLSRADQAERIIFSPTLQLAFDLFSWAGYVMLSGGATNPLISVLLPLVAIAALALPQLTAWWLATLAALLYSLLWRVYLPLPIHDAQRATHLHLLGMWLVFVVSTAIVVWFISRLRNVIREQDAALANNREQALRQDWLASVGSLAAGTAHELGSPLGTLTLLTEEMQEHADGSPTLREDLRLMQKTVLQCRAILGRLNERVTDSENSPNTVDADRWLRDVLLGWQAQHPNASLILPSSLGKAQQVLPGVERERRITRQLDALLAAGIQRIHARWAASNDNPVLILCGQGTQYRIPLFSSEDTLHV